MDELRFEWENRKLIQAVANSFQTTTVPWFKPGWISLEKELFWSSASERKYSHSSVVIWCTSALLLMVTWDKMHKMRWAALLSHSKKVPSLIPPLGSFLCEFYIFLHVWVSKLQLIKAGSKSRINLIDSQNFKNQLIICNNDIWLKMQHS